MTFLYHYLLFQLYKIHNNEYLYFKDYLKINYVNLYMVLQHFFLKGNNMNYHLNQVNF